MLIRDIFFQIADKCLSIKCFSLLSNHKMNYATNTKITLPCLQFDVLFYDEHFG